MALAEEKRHSSPSPHVPSQNGHGYTPVAKTSPTSQASDIDPLTSGLTEQGDTLSPPTYTGLSAATGGRPIDPDQSTSHNSWGFVTLGRTVTLDRPSQSPRPSPDFTAHAAATSVRHEQSPSGPSAACTEGPTRPTGQQAGMPTWIRLPLQCRSAAGHATCGHHA